MNADIVFLITIPGRIDDDPIGNTANFHIPQIFCEISIFMALTCIIVGLLLGTRLSPKSKGKSAEVVSSQLDALPQAKYLFDRRRTSMEEAKSIEWLCSRLYTACHMLCCYGRTCISLFMTVDWGFIITSLLQSNIFHNRRRVQLLRNRREFRTVCPCRHFLLSLAPGCLGFVSAQILQRAVKASKSDISGASLGFQILNRDARCGGYARRGGCESSQNSTRNAQVLRGSRRRLLRTGFRRCIREVVIRLFWATPRKMTRFAKFQRMHSASFVFRETSPGYSS